MPAPTADTPIDRVDQKNRPVGLVRRGRVFAERANFRTAHALLFDESGRLALQQLGSEHGPRALRWGSSVAGYLHAGESYGTAIRRRAREELGVAPDLSLCGLAAVEDRGVTKFVGVFEGLVSAEEPQVQDPDHVRQLRWVPLDELTWELRQHPGRFTDTFRNVFTFWQSRRHR